MRPQIVVAAVGGQCGKLQRHAFRLGLNETISAMKYDHHFADKILGLLLTI